MNLISEFHTLILFHPFILTRCIFPRGRKCLGPLGILCAIFLPNQLVFNFALSRSIYQKLILILRFIRFPMTWESLISLVVLALSLEFRFILHAFTRFHMYVNRFLLPRFVFQDGFVRNRRHHRSPRRPAAQHSLRDASGDADDQ